MGGSKNFLKYNVRECTLFVLVIVLAILVNIRSGGLFLTGRNIGDVFTDASILLIVAIGMMSTIITGGIDLSVGSTMALSAMSACIVLRGNLDTPPVLIVLIAVAAGFLAGLFNGFLVAWLGIIPIIATIGTMNIYRGITHLLSDGSWILQQDMSAGFMAISTGNLLGINNMVWIAAAVVLASWYFMNYSRTGRQFYALGNSMEAAKISGIPTRRVLLLTYGLTGAAAGLSGILFVCKFAAAQGETATGYELNVIAACVLGGVSIAGGVGKVPGVVLGAVLLAMLNNALPLMRVSPFWQQALRGAIILISILINALIARRAAKKALERRAFAS